MRGSLALFRPPPVGGGGSVTLAGKSNINGGTNTNTTTVTLTQPAAGDLILLFIAWSTFSTTRTVTAVPAGFTLAVATPSSSPPTPDALACYYKEAVGSGETSLSATISSSGDALAVAACVFHGQDRTSSTAWMDATPAITQDTSASTHTSPSLTPTKTGSLYVSWISPDTSPTITAAGGYTLDHSGVIPNHGMQVVHGSSTLTAGVAASCAYTFSASDFAAVGGLIVKAA